VEVLDMGSVFRTRKIWLVLVWVAVATVVVSARIVCAQRVEENFNGGWRFAKGDQLGKGEQDETVRQMEFDDSSWQAVRVPHDWAIAGPFKESDSGYAGKLPWQGVGWYRKTFELEKGEPGRRVYLDFDGVMAFPKVYINGRLAGEWDYGYNSFRVDATPFVTFGGKNVVAVQADTRRHGTRWYPGAGIYRNVRLTICGPVHLGHWATFVTTPAVADTSATVRVRTAVENHTPSSLRESEIALLRSSQPPPSGFLAMTPIGDANVAVEIALIAPDGRQVASSVQDAAAPTSGSREIDQLLAVADPKRWDIDSPNLYAARIVVRAGDRVVDSQTVTFGIRTAEFTANDGFHLNGRRVQLNGVCLHHDQGPLGAAFYRRAMERQLEILRDMGCNAIRTSHNPPAPELLDLTDRMGFVVWNEMFDDWDASADRLRDGPSVQEHGEKQLRNFVRRDRNHPSVVVWSIGNEIADVENNRDGHAAEQIAFLRDVVRRYDPTRPVGMACFQPAGVKTRVLAALDLTGWNYGRRYGPYREMFPDKPIVYSESAAGVSTRGFYELPPPNTKSEYSREAQVDSYDLNAASWADIPEVEFELMQRDRFVAGEFVWTGFDYLGEPTPFEREAKNSYFGIVDLCGIPKDRYYLYRSYWRPDATTVHIVPHWNWPSREASTSSAGLKVRLKTELKVPVFVYTNGDSAELFLNGKSLGRRRKGEVPERPANFAKGAVASAGGPGVAQVGNLSRPDESNLAIDGAAANAIDGNRQSQWRASGGGEGQWWQVDLGAARPIRYVALDFDREAKDYGYAIQVSNDATSWTTAATKATSRLPQYGGPTEQFHDIDASARYVRIEFTQLRSGVSPGIREFGLYPEKVESPYYEPTYKYRLRWNDVVYEPGELKAVAYKEGRPIGEAVTRTAGPLAAIRLTPDRRDLAATGEDLSYILVEAVDEKGALCPLADNAVRFEIQGPAEIAGVGNGNPLSLEPFQSDRRKLFHGKAMLIVRTREGKAGEIRVTAHSEGLAEGTASLSAK
jgi:beta-galactosidase